MTDTIEKLDQEIMLLDKQLEIDKNMFAYNMLNGMGVAMIKELETPPSKSKIFKEKIQNFFYKLFNIF